MLVVAGMMAVLLRMEPVYECMVCGLPSGIQVILYSLLSSALYQVFDTSVNTGSNTKVV